MSYNIIGGDNMAKINREAVTVRLPVELKKKIEQYAEDNSFTFSSSMVALLNRGFEQMDAMTTLQHALNVLEKVESKSLK